MDQTFVEIHTPQAQIDHQFEAPNMLLEWSNIDYRIQVKTKDTSEYKEKHIIRQVCGSASPGQLVVIMGPSGAGKSCLLDILSGRNNDYTGSVTVNGHKWSKAMNQYASYVMQDDVFYPTLTVKEHLLFQAELRMGKASTPISRQACVDDIINQFGLTKCTHTSIGGALDIRGLSGGERKRLSLATEMLTNPSLLFVDEPTSGLDSVMAESVVLQLRKLARGGRTVISTIHQPSSELFELFDQLYLLSGGRTIYNGEAAEAINYFASQGLQCPHFVNPTDYFMRQIIEMTPGSEASVRVERLAAAWCVIQDSRSKSGPDTRTEVIVKNNLRLSIVGQLNLLCKRNFTRLLRDKVTFKARVGQSIFVALLVGLIYLQLKRDQPGIQSFAGALFFISVNEFMASATPEFDAVPRELSIMLREYRGGLYHAWVWYLAKNFSELPFQIVFPMLSLLPIYFLIGFGGGPVVFFSFYIFMVLVSSAAVGMGYMVGCIARQQQVAQILGIVLILPLMIFGGLFLNAETTPIYFKWLEYISPLKYGFRGMSRAFWSSASLIQCNTEKSCLENGEQVLVHMALNAGSMFVDIAALLSINIAFRLIGILWLWLKIRQHG